MVPQVTASSIPAFVIYGHHITIANQRNATVLRECFYAQWRAQRNAAINGHKSTRDQVCDNLNKRLRAGILRDWTRGSSPLKFNRRWLPFASHSLEGPCFYMPVISDLQHGSSQQGGADWSDQRRRRVDAAQGGTINTICLWRLLTGTL